MTGGNEKDDDDALAALTPALAAPDLFIAYRRISVGDEDALLPEESVHFERAPIMARRQSGAARIAAREILARLGHPAMAIPKTPSGAPLWPAGYVGSLAHDDKWALAAVARRAIFAGVGIDIEPDAPLPDEMIDLVATPAERIRYAPSLLRSRALFVAKEAVFKAVHPLDGVFLDFHDIEIDLDGRVATVRGGRRVEIAIASASAIAARALIRATEGSG
jgi:4'-phosphopantetheinyl transferase EntD